MQKFKVNRRKNVFTPLAADIDESLLAMSGGNKYRETNHPLLSKYINSIQGNIMNSN